MKPIDLVLSKLPTYKPSGHQYRARCPGHHGKSDTSLSIAEGEGGAALLHCFGACDTEAILAALGLTWADLFPEGDRRRTRPRPKARPAASANGQPVDEAKVTLSLAAHQAVGLILGPLAPTLESETLAPYSGVLDTLWTVYTEEGSHEAVQAAWIGMRNDLAVMAPTFFRLVERRLRERHGEAAHAKGVSAPETITGSQLLEMAFPEPREAIKGLVVEGTNILGGRPKEGKSFMALDWCLAVAAGGHALGQIPVEAGDVLYIGLEDSYRRLKKRIGPRLRALKANDPTITERFHCRTDWPALDQGGVEALDAWLQAHPQCRLVVIDVLQAIAPRQPKRASSAYAADYDMLKDLHRLVTDRAIPTVLVCHTTKARHDNVVDEINATLGLAGKVDGIIVLSQAAPGKWVLKATGRDIERQELAVRFDPHAGTWVLLGDAKEHLISDERKAVLAVLRAARMPLYPFGIAQALGKADREAGKGAVRRLLFKMLSDGQVAITDDGRYTLPHTRESGNGGNGGHAGNAGNAGHDHQASAGVTDLPEMPVTPPNPPPEPVQSPAVTGVTDPLERPVTPPHPLPVWADRTAVTGVTDITKNGHTRVGGMSEDPDPPLSPVTTEARHQDCPMCDHDQWWRPPGGRLICATCHPPPRPDREVRP